MKYKHLSRENRITIAMEIGRGTPVSVIARKVGYHKATIYREINRNRLAARHYEGIAADKRAAKRRAKASALPRKLKDKLLRKVLALMKRWSPDAIAGRLGGISTRAIYDYLHRKQREHSHHRPHRHLVRWMDKVPPFCRLKIGLGKYYKRGKAKIEAAMRESLPISKRPAAANARTRAGDYEVDTAVVKGGLLLFVICRTSRFVFARKLKSKSSDEVARAMINMLAGYEVKTITSDRGSEFARYRVVEKKSGGKWYVCDARRPDQRGSIEGAIRQMRFDIPRSTPAADITPSKLAAHVRRLNNTPRKILNYQTPKEVKKKITPAPPP